MGCNNCVTMRVDCYFDVIHFAMPIFTVFINNGSCIQNFSFTECNCICHIKIQVFLNSIRDRAFDDVAVADRRESSPGCLSLRRDDLPDLEKVPKSGLFADSVRAFRDRQRVPPAVF